MDPIERALADEQDTEARERRVAARRARLAGDALGTLVLLAFLGGAGYLAYSLVSDRVPAWMCVSIFVLAIGITIVRKVVRAIVGAGTDRL